MKKTDSFAAFDDAPGSDDTVLRSRKASAFLRWTALAACTALVISLSWIAFGTDDKKSAEAAESFASGSLSGEEVSGPDVRPLRKDITMAHFAPEKPAETICRSISGTEIYREEPTAEKAEELKSQNEKCADEAESGIRYYASTNSCWNEKAGDYLSEQGTLECRKDGKLVWTVEFPRLNVWDNVVTSHGIAVWGYTDTWQYEYIYNHYNDINGESKKVLTDILLKSQPVYPMLALVDENGNIFWQCQIDHGFCSEYIRAVLDNGDGTLTVFSCGAKDADEDVMYLCMSLYDKDGNELSFTQNSVNGERYGSIESAVTMSDGYLVKLLGDRMIKLDKKGNFLNSFAYEDEDQDYRYQISDMLEFEGKIYLSIHATHKHMDEKSGAEINEIFNREFPDLKKFYESRSFHSDAVTLEERYFNTAMLYICDSKDGTLETFYSVNGSLAGELRITGDGELEWDAGYVISAFGAPWANSFDIGGACQTFRYSFDKAGKLIREIETREITDYQTLAYARYSDNH